jgi:hypothetical protein
VTTKYSYSISDWNDAKKEMRQILIERAKVRGMISKISGNRGISITRWTRASGCPASAISGARAPLIDEGFFIRPKERSVLFNR